MMRRPQLFLLPVALALIATSAMAATCTTGSDMDPAMKSSIANAATQIFRQAQTGDYGSIRAASIPAVASGFETIATAIGDNKANFTGAQANIRAEYLLDAPDAKPGRTEFYCGVLNSRDYVGFGINSLPVGQYAIVIMDVTGGKAPITLSTILQNSGGWKLAGFYARPTQLGGHDGNWYVTKAREYKSKGETHNAYFYYLEGWELLSPLSFMSTAQLDKLADELQAARPTDLPANDKPLDLPGNGKTYRVTQMFPTPVGDGIDVVVKYQVPSVADQTAAYNDNMAVIKALVQKYPELRDAFAGVVARAVAPGGNDYGSLLAMKDVK